MAKGPLFSTAARAHRLLLWRNLQTPSQTFTAQHKAGNAALCEIILDNTEQVSQIWKELDHYKATGTLLGEHAIFRKKEVERLVEHYSDLEIVKALRNIPSNILKYTSIRMPGAKTDAQRAHMAQKVAQWEAELSRIRLHAIKRQLIEK